MACAHMMEHCLQTVDPRGLVRMRGARGTGSLGCCRCLISPCTMQGSMAALVPLPKQLFVDGAANRGWHKLRGDVLLIPPPCSNTICTA